MEPCHGRIQGLGGGRWQKQPKDQHDTCQVQYDRNVKLSEENERSLPTPVSVRNWKSRTAAMRHRWCPTSKISEKRKLEKCRHLCG